MPELLPCPFCGKKLDYNSPDSYDGNRDSLKWGSVVCTSCDAAGPTVPTRGGFINQWCDAAAAKWNKRTDALKGDVK